MLAHETAHVLARRLTLERGDELLMLMPVLSEGLAQWVAYDAEGGAEQRRSDERAAAALHARGEVSFAQLADFAAFARDRDQDLIYPLGGALVRALEGRYGEAALSRVLATLAREDFPSDRRGVQLWQTAFQLAGFDLSRVLDDFFGLLVAWGEEHREELEALPRLRALVRPTDEGAEIEVRTEPPLPAGAGLVVRTRPGPDSDRSLARTHPAPEGKAYLPRRMIAHGTVCLQPGLVLDGVVLYEAWRCMPLE